MTFATFFYVALLIPWWFACKWAIPLLLIKLGVDSFTRRGESGRTGQKT